MVISWRQYIHNFRTRRMPVFILGSRRLHGDSRMYTVATRILPNVYGGYTETPGCIRWLQGDSRMHTVAIRRFPDVYGSYTEVHGAYKELYGSFFIRVLRDEKLCGFNFSPDMPDHAGPRRMPSRCLHGWCRSLHGSSRILVRDGPGCDPWMCEKKVWSLTCIGLTFERVDRQRLLL